MFVLLGEYHGHSGVKLLYFNSGMNEWFAPSIAFVIEIQKHSPSVPAERYELMLRGVFREDILLWQG